MTKAREWPNVAAEARDRAAEELVCVQRNLRSVIAGWFDLDRTELLKRTAMAQDHATTALRHLESVGARTRPE